MPTSQPLVPTGGPYDSRQETVAMMQQADIPLAPSAASSSPPMAPAPAGAAQSPSQPVPGAPMTGLDLLMAHTPEEFPFIGQEAAQPVGQTDSPLAALAASAQSQFAQAVLSRLNQSGR